VGSSTGTSTGSRAGLKYTSRCSSEVVLHPEELADKIDDFNNRMGYRFVLRQVVLPGAKPGQRLKVPSP